MKKMSTKKKVAAGAGAGVLVVIGLVVATWGSLYTVLCPWFPTSLMDRCYQSGQAAAGLDEVTLDEETIP